MCVNVTLVCKRTQVFARRHACGRGYGQACVRVCALACVCLRVCVHLCFGRGETGILGNDLKKSQGMGYSSGSRGSRGGMYVE